ncbi:MAG: VWA domain-containing protein [Oligoflexus sp.]
MSINHKLSPWVLGLGLAAATCWTAGCDSGPSTFGERVTGYGEDQSDADQIGQSDDAKSKEPPTFHSAEWTFQATEVETALLDFDADQQTVNEYFSMTDITTAATMRHKQRERSVRTEVFGQGSEQQAMSESFRQTESASGMLDLVIVIDNSNSMAEEQENLADKMMPLLSYVSESDWRIAVVTTDPSDGCLRSLISKNDANYQQAFSRAIRAGVGGSGNERGIYQAMKALQMTCASGNQWVRPNSTIAVLIVSDEDNCSNGSMCYGAAWESPSYLLNHLDQVRQLGVNARVYGLIWHPSQDQTQCPTAYQQAYVYADAIDRSQGQWGSICDDDYSTTLNAISQDLSNILKSQFALQYTPYYTTVEVMVNGVKQRGGYQVVGNVVEFQDPPPSGADIKIDYQFTTDPPKKNFRLFGQPADGTVEVYLDGVVSENFEYDAGQGLVSFEKAPMVREIKIMYRQGVELERNFAVEKGLDATAMRVAVNGNDVATNEYLYESSTGLIRFHSAPKDGVDIEVHYQQIIGPRLRYPAFVPTQIGDAFAVFDAVTRMPISYQYDGRDLHFSEADHLRGRRLMLRYENPFQNNKLIDLGFEAIPGSFQVRGDISGECVRIRVTGSVLDLENCGFLDAESVSVSFDYVGQHHQEYVLEDRGIELDESYYYQVQVDGKLTDQFHIDGHTIRFDEPLPYFAEIKVSLRQRNDH